MKIFVKVTFVLSVLLFFYICLPVHGEWLDTENRTITPLEFTDAAFIDRLPFRKELLILQRDITLSLFQNEFSGAFFGKEGYMFSTEDVSTDVLKKNLAALDVFADETGLPISLALIPQKVDVLYRYLPPLYADSREELWRCALLQEEYVRDVLPMLLQKASEGKYIYYRSDHHLTSLGSYYVYRSLSNELGISAYGSDGFSVSVVKSNFSGSEARKLLTDGDDKIALFRYGGDCDFVTENVGTSESYPGLYDYEKLKTSDPYGIFPIPDAAYVKIGTEEPRERLLVICDSYGDAAAPFLARHFDLDIIDPRYFSGSVKELTEENNYARVLCCFGMDTLASKEILYKLCF